MSSDELKELKAQMDRIELLLSRLAGEGVAEPFSGQVTAQAKTVQETTEADRLTALQAEGHFILETQGMAAYKKFWQMQLKQSKKPRFKRAA